MVTVRKSSSHRMGLQVELVFQINQHSKDEQLIINIAEYLKCGVISKHYKDAVVFKVTKLSDLNQNIIPFFLKYPIFGIKSKDFEDFVPPHIWGPPGAPPVSVYLFPFPLSIFSPFLIPLFPLSSVEERGKRSTEERGKEVFGKGKERNSGGIGALPPPQEL